MAGIFKFPTFFSLSLETPKNAVLSQSFFNLQLSSTTTEMYNNMSAPIQIGNWMMKMIISTTIEKYSVEFNGIGI